MSRFWNSYPMFRLIIPFAAGIILAIRFDMPGFLESIYLIILPVSFFLLAIITHLFPTYKFRWLTGLSIYLFLLVSGYSMTILRTPSLRQSHFESYLNAGQQFVLKVVEPPEEKLKSVRVVGKLKYLNDSTGLQKVSGKILAYFEKDSLSMALQYGDVILLDPVISKVDPPENPHQFNYQRFLSNSGIYHQAYVKSDSWERIRNGFVNPVIGLSHRIRQKMLSVLNETALSGDEFAVAAAILLGYDEKMEPELRESYSGAGAMHVLCVSGLHVGVIFFILSSY